jgi:hypothetical protein
MKKITLENYRKDKHYPRIVRAVEQILGWGDVVAPVELFVEMSLLAPESLHDWRFGRVPYLEKVIRCNLSVASRILRIFSIHGHNLNLRPSITVYVRHGKGRRTRRPWWTFEAGGAGRRRATPAGCRRSGRGASRAPIDGFRSAYFLTDRRRGATGSYSRTWPEPVARSATM